MTKPNISAVVPCYKSSDSLIELIPRLDSVLQELCDKYEIILVHDASPDNTHGTILDLSGRFFSLRVIDLTRNFGQQAAVLCGFNSCQYDYVVTLDDDLQHQPEDIPALYNFLQQQQLELVIAHLKEKQHGLLRAIGSRVVQRLSMAILDVPADFRFSSFRIMHASVAKNSLKYMVANPVVGFLLIKSTDRYANYTLQHQSRQYGSSNYNFTHLIHYCGTMMIDYSVIPLKLVGYIGGIISIVSFGLGIFYWLSWLTGNIQVSGFTTGVLLVCFFFGLLFISMGVVGAYLIRIIQNSNQHPTFLVRSDSKA